MSHLRHSVLHLAIRRFIPNDPGVIREVPALLYPFDNRITGAIAAGTHIEHQVLSLERELDDHRWFAYRFLSPFSATLRFHKAYLAQRRNYVESNIDLGLLPRLRDKSFLAFKPDYWTKVWKARQRADRTGLPYEAYMEHVFEFWGRRNGNGYTGARSRFAPEVNQLDFTETSKFAWLAELDKKLVDLAQAAAMTLADVPEFDALSYVGEPAQQEARECINLLCQLATSSSWDRLVRKWCYDYPVMSLLSMRRFMPPDIMMRVIEGLRVSPQSRRPRLLVGLDLRPSCFAVPGTFSSGAERCGSCSFAGSCEPASRQVLESIEAATGHKDPRRAKLRGAANARQRRLDAKKRAARIAAAASVEA